MTAATPKNASRSVSIPRWVRPAEVERQRPDPHRRHQHENPVCQGAQVRAWSGTPLWPAALPVRALCAVASLRCAGTAVQRQANAAHGRHARSTPCSCPRWSTATSSSSARPSTVSAQGSALPTWPRLRLRLCVRPGPQSGCRSKRFGFRPRTWRTELELCRKRPTQACACPDCSRSCTASKVV